MLDISGLLPLVFELNAEIGQNRRNTWHKWRHASGIPLYVFEFSFFAALTGFTALIKYSNPRKINFPLIVDNNLFRGQIWPFNTAGKLYYNFPLVKSAESKYSIKEYLSFFSNQFVKIWIFYEHVNFTLYNFVVHFVKFWSCGGMSNKPESAGKPGNCFFKGFKLFLSWYYGIFYVCIDKSHYFITI